MSRTLKHRIEYAAFRLARAVLSVLPEGMATGIGSLLGGIAASVVRIRRSDVDRHLLLAFPDRPEAWRSRVARASYRHLGREAVAMFRFSGWPPEKVIERTRMHGFDEVRKAAEAGGVLLLTGHLGNWEIGGAAIAARGVEIDVVAKGMANRRFGADLFRAREGLGMQVVDMERAPKGVLGALRKGRVVALLGDQNAHRGEMFVPFFGRLAATVRGPALFALRSGAPVFVGTGVRDPGPTSRYTLTFSRLAFSLSGDLERDVVGLTTRYAEALERAIRRAPEQYLWVHRRWKTRPPEEQEGEQQVTTA